MTVEELITVLAKLDSKTLVTTYNRDWDENNEIKTYQNGVVEVYDKTAFCYVEIPCYVLK